MSKWQFTKGLHDLGRGAYAYLQPSGTWGYSNAGLIADGDQSLLVETLFDERLTAEMLGVMQDATGFGADRIGVVVNTHSNGDHTFGNRLAKNAVIIASEAAAHEIREDGNPQLLAQLMKNTDAMGEVGSFFKKIFGAFDFAGVTFRLPDRTFTGEETLKVFSFVRCPFAFVSAIFLCGVFLSHFRLTDKLSLVSFFPGGSYTLPEAICSH